MLYARCCAGLLALACALPASVAALPVVPSGVPIVLNNDVPLPTRGVLLFMFDAGSGTPADETIEVVDFAGNLIEGSIEQPGPETGFRFSTGWPGVWIWRPTRSLPPRSLFTGVARNTFSGERDDFTFETLAEDPPRAISATSFEVELRAVTVDWGEPTECCTRDDRVPANCFAPDFLFGPELRVAIDAGEDDPWLRQLLFSASADAQTPLEGRLWAVRGQGPLNVKFHARGSEYCAQIALLDLATLATETLATLCLPDDEALFVGSIEKTHIDLAGPLVASGCHRPPAGFETKWCDANRGSCFFMSDGLGCQHYDALCVSGASARPIDAGVLPEISGNPEGAGCTIARVRRSSFADLAFVLGLVALAARPRRDVGRGQ